MNLPLPELITNRGDVDRTFRYALADIYCNIHPYKGGTLDGELVLSAGFDYLDPWTRDTAINIHNGASLLIPEITRNNLFATIMPKGDIMTLRDAPDSPEKSQNYWDAVIWIIGAWHYYVYTGDKAFLDTALQVARHALKVFEESEFDAEIGLFRGGAVYGDGIAAYPDTYAEPAWDHPDIGGWPERNPERAHPKGTGLPMYTLSTNCMYVEAYRSAARIAREVGDGSGDDWETKSNDLKDAINRAFWMEEEGTYRYLVDPFGGCDHQEGLGVSFAVLFGIADEAQTARILEKAHITPSGIACVWPTFPRYHVNEDTFGRHSGTVWPFIQAFWAEAALTGGRKDLFDEEFWILTRLAFHSNGFFEIYHPFTGEPYGGVQEGIRWADWGSVPRQTWSASGYLRMVLVGIVGMRFTAEGVTFEPSLPNGLTNVRLKNLPYRNMTLNVSIEGSGNKVTSITINDNPDGFLPCEDTGHKEIKITLGE